LDILDHQAGYTTYLHGPSTRTGCREDNGGLEIPNSKAADNILNYLGTKVGYRHFLIIRQNKVSGV